MRARALARVRFCCIAAVLVGGCGSVADEPYGVVAGALTQNNDKSLNGIRLNGIRLNGIGLNGIRLNGIRLNGVALNGADIDGSALAGVRGDNGAPLGGSALAGATLDGELSDGDTLRMRIDAVRRTSDGFGGDLYWYVVAYQGETGAWQPLCGVDEKGRPVEAVALPGRWDMREGHHDGGKWHKDGKRFTFACRSGALAKCVEWGYPPWARARVCDDDGGDDCEMVRLARYHQACTRMVRADYCGDGTPHTVEGVAIDYFDALGIAKEAAPEWDLEAEWDDDGARCVSATRLDQFSVLAGKSSIKGCRFVEDDCGDRRNFRKHTLLMTRVAP